MAANKWSICVLFFVKLKSYCFKSYYSEHVVNMPRDNNRHLDSCSTSNEEGWVISISLPVSILEGNCTSNPPKWCNKLLLYIILHLVFMFI